MPFLTLAALLPVASLALAVTADGMPVDHYEGAAYESGNGRLLYRESHWVRNDERVVLYRCADGRPFARKRVTGSTAAPDFELEDARDGFREGVRTRDGRREVYFQAPGAAEKRKMLAASSNSIIDAGFDAYVRQHWTSLDRKEFQRVSFLIPSRLQALDFSLTPLASAGGNRRVGLALDAWYGGLVPGMTVTYSSADRRLLRFEGIGNIRTTAGKYPSVRIEFPVDQRSRVTRSELIDANSAPLVRSCARQ